MINLTPFKRRMLDIQGYENVPNEEFGTVAKWINFPFFVCASVVAIGMTLTSNLILMGLAIIAGVAAFSPVHPLDLIYNYGMRCITGTE